MSKKALAALIGVLGVLCVACGVFLLTSRSQPDTADPTPQASPTVKPTAVPTASPTEAPESSQPEATEEPYVSPIDFASLQAQNPDIYGWLCIPNTEFDFPLVQRQGDDSFYLTHGSDGEENPAGAIFTESAYNSTDMEDPVTVAYGHQMHAGTMFGKLQATYSRRTPWTTTARSSSTSPTGSTITRCSPPCPTTTATFSTTTTSQIPGGITPSSTASLKCGSWEPS